MDELIYLDDINIKFKEYIEQPAQPVKLLAQYRTKPFDYQLEGIKYGLSHDKWLLLDAPGLGKSLQIIYIAEELKAQRNLQHCLIICGIATLTTNWKKEIEKHSKLSCRILGQKITKTGKLVVRSVKERAEELMKPIDEFFIITNIETIRSDDILAAFQHSENSIEMIAVDEFHKAKSSTSQQGSNLLEMDATYKIGATGTLLLNDPLDCYTALKWIGKERSTVTNFRYYYADYDDNRYLVRLKHTDLLKKSIEDVSLRRTKDLLDLPPKTIIDEFVDMSDSHKKFYDNIVDNIFDDVDLVNMTKRSMLAKVTRLRQATSCPSVLTSKDIKSSKIERCVDLVDEILAQGDKVVIFSGFKAAITELSKALAKYNPLIGTGDMNQSDISDNIDKFQTDKDYKVFICTHQKMGTGITLTAARYAIFIDTPWTAGVYDQACDRIHRIGSKEPVFIYNLICADTIDESVSQILKRKAALSDYIIDDEVDDNALDILKKYLSNL